MANKNYFSLLIAAGVVLFAAALFVTGVLGGRAPLTGTDLGKQPAPDFVLTDHRGQPVRLSDFRGKAVVLSFIYTACPDVCPFLAENLRTAYEILPEEARDDVALVAVTLDPARDTQQALQHFIWNKGLPVVTVLHWSDNHRYALPKTRSRGCRGGPSHRGTRRPAAAG